nr:MAG: RNA-dependent RNA polymerase [Owegonang virus 8]
MACKEKYGDLRYNNANRLVSGDFCRDYLRKNYPDLRVVDRVKHATYAVELALTPTAYSLACMRYAREESVAARRGAVAPPK